MAYKTIQQQLTAINSKLDTLITDNHGLRTEVRELRKEVSELKSGATASPLPHGATASPPPRAAASPGVGIQLVNGLTTPPSTPRKDDIENWHHSKEFQDLVTKFHDNNAKCPAKEVMMKAKARNIEIVEKIRDYLGKDLNVINKVEYTGSSFEELKIASTELEFDCMVILRGGKNLVKITDGMPPGYSQFLLKEGNTSHLKELMNKEGLLSSEWVHRWFIGKMQNARDHLIDIKVVTEDNMTLHANGPAVMMKVFKDDGEKWYSVDMVPTFSVDDENYVPKSYKEVEKPGEVFTTWRRSFSLDEKKILRTVDKGSGCRRKCLRMLKALRAQETSLQPLCTYFLKTTLLNMVDKMDEEDRNRSWEMEQLGVHFIALLRRLSDYLDKGELPHHFIPEFNILEPLLDRKTVLYNMATRLDNLLSKQTVMEKLLQS